jgi:hypothetical protein
LASPQEVGLILPPSYDAEKKKLLDAVRQHAECYGTDVVAKVADAVKIYLAWLGYLSSISTRTADSLLEGAKAAVVEVAGCLALGLVRPALGSLRAEVDMTLAWIFFDHHAVEWEHTKNTGENIKLRAEILRYLGQYYRRFKERYQILAQYRTRSVEEPYDLLSAHIHSQVSGTIPTATSLSALVGDINGCRECVQLQSDVAEYLADVLAACYADRWQDLPAAVTDSLKERLSPAKLKELCR